MHENKGLLSRIEELEKLLEMSERKSDILTNLLIEANAEFERALEKATESEANIRAVFENAPEAIYLIDTETRDFYYCNPYTLDWLGYAEEELLAMRIDDILESGTQGIQENIRKAVQQGIIHIQERRFRKKNGTVVDAEITGTVVEYQRKKYLIALVRDITERKQIEELSRYKELFENVSDPVFINDFNGRFLEANDVACSCFGSRRDQILEKVLRDFINPAQWNILREQGDRLQNGEKVQFELEILTESGESIPFEFHARPIAYKGKPAALSVARDLSVRKKMEEALVKSARLTAVGEMASGVAHNFNNLLQMIMGAGEAALTKLESGKIREGIEAIRNILQACHRGADIVCRIKEFRDVRPGETDETESFDLGELIQDAVALTKPLWKDLSDSRKYRINYIKAMGCFIRGKPSAIYEVLVNLIKNGLEAMPQGGILTISTHIQNKAVYLKVKDTGLGISKGDQHRIFEPFFTTKGSKSSGLGLASSYGIIKKHKGEMHVKSDLGEGTTFTVVFPMAEKIVGKKRENIISAGRKRIRFLLIDDEINILKAMEMFFEDSEVDLATAMTGKEGLEAIRQGGFDVTLCDLGMDDMDGWEVGREIKKYCREHGRPQMPFLLYTGVDKQFDIKKLEESGVDRVVRKPIPCKDLLEIIREVISTNCAGNRRLAPLFGLVLDRSEKMTIGSR